MADDVTLNSMSGGSVVATDDSGTGHVQIVKLAYSADGSRTPIEADADGLEVKVSNTVEVALGTAAGSPSGGSDKGIRVLALQPPGGPGPTTLESLNNDSSGRLLVAATQSGTWNVGSITTLPSLPAGANTIGGVTVQNASLAVTPLSGMLPVIERGTVVGSTSASVTTTSGQIVASSSTRRTIVLTNLGSDYVWIGASGVTDNQGIRLAPGQALTIDKSPTAAVHAKAATGTQTVAIFTESD